MTDKSRGLVISFPRSGLNWLRHCVEQVGQVRTPGRQQIFANGPVLFDRAHNVRRIARRSDYAGLYHSSGDEVYDRVALLLRDPDDCFISHYLTRAEASFSHGLQAFITYSNNIAAFDSLQRPEKRVFYFNDFINSRDATCEFLSFFGIETDLPDFEELQQSSRAWYRAQHCMVAENARPQLRAKQQAAIQRQLRRELGDKFERYLGRFYEKLPAESLFESARWMPWLARRRAPSLSAH